MSINEAIAYYVSMSTDHVRGLLIALLLIGAYLLAECALPDTAPPQLGFPIAEPESVEQVLAQHTSYWGKLGTYENGIDLAFSTNVTVIAPCNGSIIEYSQIIIPYSNNTMFSITISIDSVWTVKLILKSGVNTPNEIEAQTRAIYVEQRVVTTGTEIARLLCGTYKPHLYYVLLYYRMGVSPYDFSTPEAKATLDDIAARTSGTVRCSYDFPDRMDSPTYRLKLGIGFFFTAIAVVGIACTFGLPRTWAFSRSGG